MEDDGVGAGRAPQHPERRRDVRWWECSLPRFAHFCFRFVGGCVSKQPKQGRSYMKYNLWLEALSAFESRTERRNHSDDTAACPTQPTCPLKRAGKVPSLIRRYPQHTVPMRQLLLPCSKATLRRASEHAACSLPPHGITNLIFKKARRFTILTSNCRMR